MKYLRILSVAVPTVILLWITYTAQGVLDSGDGVQHFLIAKWSFIHPELFLDHWGKPFFTLLSAPFAYVFGFKGMIIFNILLFIISSVLLMKIIDRLFNKSRYLALFAPLFLFSAPIYIEMVLSGMTEILFGTLSLLAVYLLIEKKYLWAAVVASFLPFSRPEYGVVLPLIALTILYRKQWKALPFLLSGFVLYGLWGLFVFNDFLWFIHQHTYTGEASFYGHGEWYHFIKQYSNITGKFLALMLIIATIGVLHYLTKKANWSSGYAPELFLVITGSICGVLFVHSYIWWKGTNSSLGLIRVMATVIPFIVLYSIGGIAELYALIREKINMPALLALLNLLLIIFTVKAAKSALRAHYFPIKFSSVDQLVMDAAQFTKSHHLNKQRIIYQYPLYAYGLGVDIYDNETVYQLYSVDKSKPSISMNKGDIMFWDAHFGPNESELPLDTVLNDEHLRLVKAFFPKERIKVLGDNDFCAFIFEKPDDMNPVKIFVDTLAKDTIVPIENEFPFLLRISQKNNSIEEDFNRIQINYTASVPKTADVYFVIAIKKDNNNVYYASERIVKGKHQVELDIPPIQKDELLEIQLYNPQQKQEGSINFSLIKKNIVK